MFAHVVAVVVVVVVVVVLISCVFLSIFVCDSPSLSLSLSLSFLSFSLTHTHTLTLALTLSFPFCSYAVQLMTPCKVLAATNGRENIIADDVSEINELFFDSKQSSKILTEQADKFLY